MTALAGQLGVQTLGQVSLEKLADRITDDSEHIAPRTQLYAFMRWLSDQLLDNDSFDEGWFSRLIARWCLFVNNANADFTSSIVVGTFEEWFEEHRQVEPHSAEWLAMVETEIKRFHGLPTDEPHSPARAGEQLQPSPLAKESPQQALPVNDTPMAPPAEGFGHIHPDRLKLSTYGDSNPEKDEVIDLDNWQPPVVDISSDDDEDPKADNDLSFLTGSNRMFFGDNEAGVATDLQSKKKTKAKSKKSGPSLRSQRKNNNPCGRCGIPGT